MFAHIGFGVTTTWGHFCFTLCNQCRFRKYFIKDEAGGGWHFSIDIGPLVIALNRYGDCCGQV